MSPTAPSSLPDAIVDTSMTMSQDKSKQSEVAAAAHELPQQHLQPRVSDTNVGSPSAGHSISQKPARNVHVSSTQMYHVPQLQEPPRRYGLMHGMRDRVLPVGASVNLPGARATPGHDVLSSPTHNPNSSSTIFSGPASSSTASSTFVSLRDSPLTPWENYHPSSTESALAMGNLRPTAGTFIPPSATLKSPMSLLGHQTGSFSAVSAGPLSAKNSLGPFDINDLNGFVGLGISCLETNSPARSPIDHLAATTSTKKSDSGPDDPRGITPDVSGSSTAASPLPMGGFFPGDTTHEHFPGDVHFSPSTSHSFLESTSPVTTQAADEDTALLARDASNASGDTVSSSPSVTLAVLGPDEPEVWEERQQPKSFKKQLMEKAAFEETFEGSFDMLATLNPDQYRMPWGSRVVCIKTSSVTNIVLSLKNGFWACPGPVSDRIKDVWVKRASDDEQILLLFSVPGSKHFCGVAEMTDFIPDQTTDIWDDGKMYKGAMVLHWLFCKVVAYDEVKNDVEKIFPSESATQMWNGMHYPVPIGREVIKSYVQSPHTENLLVKHKVSQEHCLTPRRGALSGPQGHHSDRGLAQNKSAPGKGSDSDRSDGQRGKGGFSSTPRPAPPFRHASQKTEAPVYVHGSGSVTPAGSAMSGLKSPFGKVFTQGHGDLIMTAPMPSLSSPRTLHQDKMRSPGARHVGKQPSLPKGSPQTKLQTPTKQNVRVGGPKSTPKLGGQAGGEGSGSPFQFQTPNAQTGVYRQAASASPSFHYKSSDKTNSMTPVQRMQHSHMQPLSRAESPAVAQTRDVVLGKGQYAQLFPEKSGTILSPFPAQVASGVASPFPSQGGHQAGHRLRSSAAKSSVDLRMDNMVDNLVGSPSIGGVKLKSTGSFDGLDNLGGT